MIPMADIVIADDDPAVLRALKGRLKQAGHAIRTATNGVEVLGHVRRQVPDLVITDIIMPECEGIETIVALRRSCPGIKLLAISGGGNAGRASYLSAAASLGADSVLTKPFTTRQLLDAIDAIGLSTQTTEI